MNIDCAYDIRSRYSLFFKVMIVKGVALKTHQRLRLWNPQAFEKA